MLLPVMRERLFTALAGTVDVLDALLGPLQSHDPLWDFRPDPDRFTIREVVAHLVDYEAVWMERIRQTREEHAPDFVPADKDQLAIDHDYAHSDVASSHTLFRQRRMALVEYLKGLAQEDWQRIGRMGGGLLTLEEQASFVAIHDGYHLQQVAEWMREGHRTL